MFIHFKLKLPAFWEYLLVWLSAKQRRPDIIECKNLLFRSLSNSQVINMKTVITPKLFCRFKLNFSQCYHLVVSYKILIPI